MRDVWPVLVPRRTPDQRELAGILSPPRQHVVRAVIDKHIASHPFLVLREHKLAAFGQESVLLQPLAPLKHPGLAAPPDAGDVADGAQLRERGDAILSTWQQTKPGAEAACSHDAFDVVAFRPRESQLAEAQPA